MITRIIKFRLKPDAKKSFDDLIRQFKDELLAFPGIHHLDILSEKENQNSIFILMIFYSETDLEQYRSSELNKVVKKRLKEMIDGDFLVWMVENVIEGK